MSKDYRLSKYNTIIFDCDGVVLDSNFVKADAFAALALPFGTNASRILKSYHLQNGALSRHVKLNYLIDEILPSVGFDGPLPSLDILIADFSSLLSEGLRSCRVADSLQKLRSLTPSSSWMMASGADEVELIDLMNYHGLINFFDKGIFGGPAPKLEILLAKKDSCEITSPSLLIGDSYYDYECIKAIGGDFIFVSGWTAEVEWQSFVDKHNIPVINSLRCLVK